MKTVEEIQRNILEIDRFVKSEPKPKKRLINEALKRKEVLKMCVNYLQTNPRPEFVKEMNDAVILKLKIIESRYGIWAREHVGQKKSAFMSTMGVNDLKAKLETLNYLIN